MKFDYTPPSKIILSSPGDTVYPSLVIQHRLDLSELSTEHGLIPFTRQVLGKLLVNFGSRNTNVGERRIQVSDSQKTGWVGTNLVLVRVGI